MTDSLLHLTFYALIVRQVGQFLKGFYKPRTVLGDRTLVFLISALFIYVLGVDPVGALKIGKVIIHPVLNHLLGTSTLAGLSMASHDALQFWQKVRENGNGNGGK